MMLRPSWTRNIGEMIDAGIACQAFCDRCGKFRAIDLSALAMRLGRDFDLWNRRTRCRLTPGCTGFNRFQHGGRGVMRHMWDDATSELWDRADAKAAKIRAQSGGIGGVMR